MELPRVVKASFSLYGVFLFCVVFWYQMCGGEVEYMKCIYNTISPHTFHEDVIFFLFFFLVLLWGMWDLSSPTGDETHALCNGSVKFEPLGHQGSPGHPFFARGIIRERVCSPPETHVFCN